MDTVEANLHLGFQMDQRDYGIGAQMLRHLGITKLRLMSNNPKKRVGLDRLWIGNRGKYPNHCKAQSHNEKYLQTKRDKLGHELQEDE